MWGPPTWHASCVLIEVPTQSWSAQKAAGAAGGGGGKFACTTTVETAARSGIALLSTMSGDMAKAAAKSQSFAVAKPRERCGAFTPFGNKQRKETQKHQQRPSFSELLG